MKFLRPFTISFSFFSILLVLTALDINIYGQCGVYFKRSYTNIFPYRAYIDKTEDMTGDGIPDLIGFGIDTANNQPTRLFIIPNNGDGTFGSPTIINAPPQMVFNVNNLIGDFNNDSRKDIVAYLQTSPPSVLVYLNNGNGSYTPQTLVNASQMGSPEHLLDINNDGIGDYIGYAGPIRYSLGNANGTFNAPVELNDTGTVFPGDFNGDNRIDLIIRETLYLNQGNAIFTTSSLPAFDQQERVRYVKDFTGDGKSDILTQTTSISSNKISLLTRTETGFNRTDYNISNLSSWYGSVFIGNFSGNNALDVVYSAYLLNKTLVFTNNGSGAFARQDFDYKFNANFNLMADFDNDGKTDVINSSSGNSYGYGAYKIFPEANITLQKNVCNRPGQPRIVDFDRSSSTDYAFWNPSSGFWSYKTSGNSLPATGYVAWGSGSLGDIPAPGDFDGDGVTDLAVYRNSTGVWYVRRSSDSQWIVFQFGLTGDKPVAADYDGDSITDIAVWRPSDGNWYVWLMGTNQFYAVNFGLNGDKPIPEDFDGDLKTDVAVYRPSTGTWYYLKSSDGGFSAIQWGIDSDTPVPADYDGDGKADISVYRPSENNLYLLRSYNFSYIVYQFGLFQDIPQPGDYNGDYVFDFGVYRPFASRWYSSDSQSQTDFGGGSSVIPTSSILRNY